MKARMLMSHIPGATSAQPPGVTITETSIEPTLARVETDANFKSLNPDTQPGKDFPVNQEARTNLMAIATDPNSSKLSPEFQSNGLREYAKRPILMQLERKILINNPPAPEDPKIWNYKIRGKNLHDFQKN
jgi:hypothetical protein